MKVPRFTIFQKVKCRAFLQKYSDGVFLSCQVRMPYDNAVGYYEVPASGNRWNDSENIVVTAMQNVYKDGKWDTVTLKDLSSFNGDTVEKRYRRRIEEDFSGFIVGVTHITVSAQIGTDYSENHIYVEEGEYNEYVKHLIKKPRKEKVAVVYFKNNSRRYVLMDDIEICDEST